jgi:ElaB/YqjD/DUF883 family membrane-anchored ribosome-binding protein
MPSPKPSRPPESPSTFRPALHELEARDVPATGVVDFAAVAARTAVYSQVVQNVRGNIFQYATSQFRQQLQTGLKTIQQDSNGIVADLTQLQKDFQAQAQQQAADAKAKVDALLAQSRTATNDKVAALQTQYDEAAQRGDASVAVQLRNAQGQLITVQAQVEKRFQDVLAGQLSPILYFYDQAGRAIGVTISQAQLNALQAGQADALISSVPDPTGASAGGAGGAGGAAAGTGGAGTPAGATPASAASLFQQAQTGNDQQTASALAELYKNKQLTADMVNSLVQSGRISAAAGAQLQGLIQQQVGGGTAGGGAAGGGAAGGTGTGSGTTGGTGTGGTTTGGTNTGGGTTNTTDSGVVGTYRRADQPTSSSLGFGNTDPPAQSVSLTLNANGTGSITVAPFDGTPFTATFPYTASGNTVNADANGVTLLGVTVNGNVLRGGIDVTRGGKSLSFSGQREDPNARLQLTKQ